MSSAQLSKIGIIAGGGALPRTLLAHCDAHGIETFTIGFDGQTDAETLKGREHIITRLGAAGSMMSTLRDRGFKDLVIIGAVKRPKLADMRPDLRTAAFFAKLGLRALGDDGLLKAVRSELEDEGFIIHAIQDVVGGLLIGRGSLGSVQPNSAQEEDIAIGLTASRKIGEDDIGQSVVVCDGAVIGTEDEGGTNALIRRAARPGAILVKSSKPQQDRKLDMPTLGSETIKLCASLGYAGIAAEAGGVLLADRDAMGPAADAAGLFVVGV